MKKAAARPWVLERHGLNPDDYDLEIYNEKGFVEPTDPENLTHIVKCVNVHELVKVELRKIHDAITNGHSIQAQHLCGELLKKVEAE